MTVGYHHHHHHCNQFIRLDIVDDGGLILFLFVFLSVFLYWMAYSGMDGVECGGLSRV